MKVTSLEFGYDTTNDGVYIAENGVVVWWEQSFDSLGQYLMMLEPGKLYEIAPLAERALPEDEYMGATVDGR